LIALLVPGKKRTAAAPAIEPATVAAH
jgi:hypothetical protein